MGSEITRKFAEIVKISALTPIEGADKIELASVYGWDVVVQKGLYEVGDLVVYFQIDSLLPEIPEFEFLRKNCYVSKSQNGSGFRIKIIRLRGVPSYGLLMPIKELWNYIAPFKEFLEEGDDITEILGVKKWEKIIPASLAGTAKGNFPSFIPKTDQPRIQSWFKNFLNLKHTIWEVSGKMDGSSMTVYLNDDVFGVCSRNLDLKETDDNAFWKAAREFNIEENLRKWSKNNENRNIALQMELCGPGIQGNYENLEKVTPFLFDIFDIDKQSYVTSSERISIWYELACIPHVPVYEETVFGFENARDFVEFAETAFGGKSISPNTNREGLVFKNVLNPNQSFKAISSLYLFNEKDE